MIKGEVKTLSTKSNPPFTPLLFPDVVTYSTAQKRIPRFPVMVLLSVAKDTLPQTPNALVNPQKIFESK